MDRTLVSAMRGLNRSFSSAATAAEKDTIELSSPQGLLSKEPWAGIRPTKLLALLWSSWDYAELWMQWTTTRAVGGSRACHRQSHAKCLITWDSHQSLGPWTPLPTPQKFECWSSHLWRTTKGSLAWGRVVAMAQSRSRWARLVPKRVAGRDSFYTNLLI